MEQAVPAGQSESPMQGTNEPLPSFSQVPRRQNSRWWHSLSVHGSFVIHTCSIQYSPLLQSKVLLQNRSDTYVLLVHIPVKSNQNLIHFTSWHLKCKDFI